MATPSATLTLGMPIPLPSPALWLGIVPRPGRIVGPAAGTRRPGLRRLTQVGRPLSRARRSRSGRLSRQPHVGFQRRRFGGAHQPRGELDDRRAGNDRGAQPPSAIGLASTRFPNGDAPAPLPSPITLPRYPQRPLLAAEQREYELVLMIDPGLEDSHSLKIADGVLRFRIFRVDPRAPVIAPPASGAPAAAKREAPAS
jgi:hypothetical protein